MKESLPSPSVKRMEDIRIPSPYQHSNSSPSSRKVSPRRQSLMNGVVGVKRQYHESPLGKNIGTDEQPTTPTSKLPLRRRNKISD